MRGKKQDIDRTICYFRNEYLVVDDIPYGTLLVSFVLKVGNASGILWINRYVCHLPTTRRRRRKRNIISNPSMIYLSE